MGLRSPVVAGNDADQHWTTAYFCPSSWSQARYWHVLIKSLMRPRLVVAGPGIRALLGADTPDRA